MTKGNIEVDLFKASRSGNLKKAQEAIQMHADVNARDKAGWTPLHFASARGHAQIVAQLINSHANINIQAYHSKWTPLFLAQQNNYNDDHKMVTVIDILKSRGGIAI